MTTVRIVGWVDAIFFENPSNMYKVMRVSIDEALTEDVDEHEIIVTGQIASVDMEVPYEFMGEIVVHPKYGEQLQVIHYQQVTPSSREGLIEYLSSYRFKGVGKVLAERIVDHVGLDVIDTIFQDPTVLDGIPGLIEKTKTALIEALQEHKGTEKVYIQLTEWGFARQQSDKIVGQLGSDSIQKIKENPYSLCMDIEGVTFTKVDTLAKTLGFEADSKERIAAAIYTVIRDHCYQEGDTYLDLNDALHRARHLLENNQPVLIDNQPLIDGLTYAVHQEVIHHHQRGLMIPSISFAEQSIAKCLQDMMKHSDVQQYSQKDIDQAFAYVEKESGIRYDTHQKAALLTAINSPMTIITGGPGTGKTTLIRGLILLHAYLNDLDLEILKNPYLASEILLAAPTGRAAKRMTDTTGLPAATIHRMIGFTKDTTVDQEVLDELDGKLLIVDEMSMVDTWLMNWLIRAIPYHMQVVFVGDRDQLPSVGPGQVFADLIDSQCIPTVILQKIYRQAKDSSIVSLAHQVRQGQLPSDFLDKLADRTFINCRPGQIGQVVEQVVRAAHQKGFNAMTMQVLAPMYKGPAGINQMNTILQELLNPPSPKSRRVTHFDTEYRVGDKVIQLVNNTDEGIFNGDIGHIEAILTDKESESKQTEVVVVFDDDREYVYQKKDLDQLSLAYCTSIHKAQGSEYDLVILPLVDLHSRLLRKDLLYTAVTRAQKSLVMIGNPQSFYKAVGQIHTQRRTFLKEYLQTRFEGSSLFQQSVSQNDSIIPSISDEQVKDSHPSREQGDDSEEILVLSTHQTTQDDGPLSQDIPNTLKVSSSDIRVEDNSHPSLNDTPPPTYHLTLDNYLSIDPMIGMEGVRPQDFMRNNQ